MTDPNARRPIYSGLLSPADTIIIGYLIVIAALILIAIDRVPYWWLLVAAHVVAIAIVVLIARRYRSSGLVRGWYPVAVIPFTYKELTYLIPLINPNEFDRELAAIDRQMFGVDPTVWLERLTWPALTELFQLSYITYYFLPLVLGAVLWRKGWAEKFHFFVFVIVLGFYLSYLGYIAVPALGPRFLPEIQSQHTKPLSGVLLFDTIHSTLNELEGKTYDAFPSGHTELTLLVLYYAQRFHRRTFWWILPAGSALIISTVYLRYHYVIDVIAGAFLALAIILMARPLYRRLGGQLQGSGVRSQGSRI
ncbi:MAG TPA: phosphatase PAP2 family protein [Blastocatellia bacterium]|nr:phosphatase PAP2 family protein [Blastocatellia bacterium]